MPFKKGDDPNRAPSGDRGDPIIKHVRKITSQDKLDRLIAHTEAMAARAEKAAARAEAAAARTRPIVVGPSTGTGKGQAKVFTQARRNEYLRHREAGLTSAQAAQAVGIGAQAIGHARRTDPGFKEADAAIEEVRDADDAARARANLMAASDAGDVRASIELMRMLAPEKYAPRAAELKITGQIDHQHELDTGPALERIALLHARLAARELGAGDAGLDIIDVEPVE